MQILLIKAIITHKRKELRLQKVEHPENWQVLEDK